VPGRSKAVTWSGPASAPGEVLLAQDCCAVGAILDDARHWRVPEMPPSNPLLTVGSRSVTALDGPRHTALREVMREGVKRAARPAKEIIAGVIDEVGLPTSGQVDLVQQFVAPIVFGVKARLLGVAESSGTVAAWTARMFGGNPGPPGPVESPADLAARAGHADSEVINYWSQCAANDRLTEEELEAVVLLFAVAGNDAMIALAGQCLVELAEAPGRQCWLRERTDLVGGFVGEMAKRQPPVRYTFRIRPGGGLTVVLLLAEAKGGSCSVHGQVLSLPFGRGVHACLGADLGLEVVTQAITSLLRRAPWIRATGAPLPHPNGIFRGFVKVPATFTAGSAEGWT
jgi:cytochrome P450